MLADQIQADLVAAMKAKDKTRLNTLRSVTTEIKVAQTAPGAPDEIDDSMVKTIIKRQIKQRVEAAEGFASAGNSDGERKELEEKQILESYGFTPMSPEEVAEVVNQVLSDNGFTDMSNMGQAIRAANEACDGRADGKQIADLVKSKLSN